MTKAEQFIRDYTKSCSNELTVGGYHEWVTPEQAMKAVEIAIGEIAPTKEEITYLSKAILTLCEEGDCKTGAVLNELREKLRQI